MKSVDVTADIARQLIRSGRKEVGEKIMNAWMDDEIVIEQVADSHFDMENLKGDCYNPEVNHDIPKDRLAREEAAFEARVEAEGVWGIVGYVKDGNNLDMVDSCFGFVGRDFLGSGYDVDIANAVLARLNKPNQKIG